MSDSITIKFPDGSEKVYARGVTGLEIARSISEGLARNALSIKVNHEVWDLNRMFQANDSISLLNIEISSLNQLKADFHRIGSLRDSF